MPDYFGLYIHQFNLPSFQRFLAMPNNQILLSNKNSLTRLSSPLQVINTFQLTQQARSIVHLKDASVLVKSVSELIHIDLSAKEVIKRIPLTSDGYYAYRECGSWNGGLFYVLHHRLFNDQKLLLTGQLKNKIVEKTNKGNLVIYSQFGQGVSNITLVLAKSPNNEEGQKEIQFVQYSLFEQINNLMIVKIMEWKNKLLIFGNFLLNSTILFYDKDTSQFLCKIQLPDNIIEVVQFQEQRATAILLTSGRNPASGAHFLSEECRQCIKLINLQRQEVLSQFYIPFLEEFSFCPGSSSIYFLAEKKAINSKLGMLKLVTKTRTYMHLLVQSQLVDLYSKQLMRKVTKVLME